MRSTGAGAVNRVRVRSTGAGAVNRCGKRGQQVRKAWSTGAESVVNRCGKRGQQVRCWQDLASVSRIFSDLPDPSRSPRSSRKGEREEAGRRAFADATRLPAFKLLLVLTSLTEGRLLDSRGGMDPTHRPTALAVAVAALALGCERRRGRGRRRPSGPLRVVAVIRSEVDGMLSPARVLEAGGGSLS